MSYLEISQNIFFRFGQLLSIILLDKILQYIAFNHNST